MKYLFSLLILISALIYGCGSVHHNDARFLGMWRLEMVESLDETSGKWEYDSTFFGWTGYIIYDGSSNMGVQLTPRGYKDYKTDKSIDNMENQELKDYLRLYQSNLVYFGKYFTHDNTIEHRRLSATNPKDWGTVLVRNFEFRKDTLILTAHEKMLGRKSRLWWIKMN